MVIVSDASDVKKSTKEEVQRASMHQCINGLKRDANFGLMEVGLLCDIAV